MEERAGAPVAVQADQINAPQRPETGVHCGAEFGERALLLAQARMRPHPCDALVIAIVHAKAVARIIQGDSVIVSPCRRARFCAPRTGSRGQACLVS